MHRSVVGLALWLVPGIVAYSAEPALPPTQQVLRATESGDWHLEVQVAVSKYETRTRSVIQKIPETKTVTETVNGKAVEKTVTQYRDVMESRDYTVCVPGYQMILKSVPAAMLKAYETDGRAIPLDKLRSRVGREALVVVSDTEGRLPDIYASLFKPGTIVIVIDHAPAAQPATASSAGPPIASPPVAGSAPASLAPASPAPAGGSVIPAGPAPAGLPVAGPATVAVPASHVRSPAPQFVILGRTGVDDVVLRRAMESTSPTSGMIYTGVGAATKQIPIQMMQTVRRTESFILAAKHLRFHLDDIADVPFDRIKERFGRESAVVYSADGQAVDPFWLQNLRSSTFVVTGPQLPMMTPNPGPVALPVMTAPMAVPVPGDAPVGPGPAEGSTPPAPVVSPVPRASTREPINPVPAR